MKCATLASHSDLKTKVTHWNPMLVDDKGPSREQFVEFVKTAKVDTWDLFHQPGSVGRKNDLANIALSHGFAGLFPQGFDKMRAEGDEKTAIARFKVTMSPYRTRKGDHRQGQPIRKTRAAVATVNAFTRTRPRLKRHVWDLRQFVALKDCIEFDELQMLRAEYVERKAELERLGNARWLRAARWLAAYRKAHARPGLCAGQCKDGSQCDNRVKEGARLCHLHTDQKPPVFNLIAFAARYRVTLWAYIDCQRRLEQIRHRGWFLRSVLKRMLQETEEPVAANDFDTPYFVESREDVVARIAWAEGRAIDLDIEDYGPDGEAAAHGDDAPEEWRDWEAAQSYNL